MQANQICVVGKVLNRVHNMMLAMQASQASQASREKVFFSLVKLFFWHEILRQSDWLDAGDTTLK